MTARIQWFAVDPDQDVRPSSALLAEAMEKHDVPGCSLRSTPHTRITPNSSPC
jgi:hypothetical protein